jgi:hypothetical protein
MVKEYDSRRVKRVKRVKRTKQKRTKKRIKVNRTKQKRIKVNRIKQKRTKQKRTNKKRTKQKRTKQKRTKQKRTRSSRKQYPYDHIGGVFWEGLGGVWRDKVEQYLLHWCLTVVPQYDVLAYGNPANINAYCSICGGNKRPFDWLWCDEDLYDKIYYGQKTGIEQRVFEEHVRKVWLCRTNGMERCCIPWRCVVEGHIWDGTVKETELHGFTTNPATGRRGWARRPLTTQIKINLVNIESKLKKERWKYGLKVLDVGQDEPIEKSLKERKKYNGWIIPSATTEGEMKKKTINMTNYPDKGRGNKGNPIYEIQYNAAWAEYQRRKKVQYVSLGTAGIGAGVAAAMLTPAILAAVPAVAAAAAVAPIITPAATVLASGISAAAVGSGVEKLGEYQHVKFKDELEKARRRFRRKPKRRKTDWVDTGPVLEPGPTPFSVDQGSTPFSVDQGSDPEPELVVNIEDDLDVVDVEDDDEDTSPVQPASAVLARGNATVAVAPALSGETLTTRAPTSRWEP